MTKPVKNALNLLVKNNGIQIVKHFQSLKRGRCQFIISGSNKLLWYIGNSRNK